MKKFVFKMFPIFVSLLAPTECAHQRLTQMNSSFKAFQSDHIKLLVLF